MPLAEQRHDLAGSDSEIDAEQHPAVAIPGFEPADLKHPLHIESFPPAAKKPLSALQGGEGGTHCAAMGG